MDDKQLRRALRELAQESIPDDLNRWPAIHTKLEQSEMKPRSVLTLSRPLRLIASVAIVLLVSAAAVALYQTGFWRQALLDLCEQGGYTELGLSQTVDGVTVTLERGYVDTQMMRLQILVEGMPPSAVQKSLEQDAGMLIEGFGGRLTISHHRNEATCPYSPIPHRRATPEPDRPYRAVITVWGVEPPSLLTLFRPGTWSLSDYLAGVYWNEGNKEMRLEYKLTLDPSLYQPLPLPESTDEFAPTATPQPRLEPVTFEFGFTLAITKQRRVIEVGQTVVHDSVSITLNDIELEGTEARFNFCFTSLPAFIDNSTAKVSLIANGAERNITRLGGLGSDGPCARGEAQMRVSHLYWAYDYFDTGAPATFIFSIESFITDPDSIDTPENRAKWEVVVERINAAGGEVTLYTSPMSCCLGVQGRLNGEVYEAALIETGLSKRYTGPWTFTVDVPGR